MNRKSFFKKLGAGALAVAVAPKLLEAKPELPIEVEWNKPIVTELKGIEFDLSQIPDGVLMENLCKERQLFNDRLIKLFEDTPEVADIVADMVNNGSTFRQALTKHL